MQVRRASPTDADRLLQIWLEASRLGHPFLGEEVLQEQLQQVRDIYLPGAENWLAEDGEGIAGFIGLIGNHIGGLFVAPETVRRGVGRLLVTHISARSGALTADVYEQNGTAVAFYRSCGFDAIGRKEVDDEGRPFPLLRMRRAG